VAATNDIDDVLRVKPDVVNFNGVWPDIDTFCTLLENGINVVTTSDWITGYHRDRNHPHPSGKKPTELIEAACRRGKATFYGTGMNPGLAQILSVVATAGMGRVDHITVLETVDVSCHHSVDTWKNVGYGRPVDDPEVPGLLETGCAVFADSIYMMADCFDLEIDDIAFDCELGACTEDVDLGWWTLPKGSVGGSLAKFKGVSHGEPKIEVHLEWQMTPKTEPGWKVQGCYITTIEGDPTIVNRHMIFPATGMPHGAWTPEYFASVGMTITGMPALNAIRSVCEAKPGLTTSADLPLRAFAGRFHDKARTDASSVEVGP
jgi:4-hydroxy-tetrahydrodipicolinate reductase